MKVIQKRILWLCIVVVAIALLTLFMGWNQTHDQVLMFIKKGTSSQGMDPQTINMIVYNVGGLPYGLSSTKPEINTGSISKRLEAWDLIAVQEDFAFHDALAAQLSHVYQTTPERWGWENGAVGDGLNLFSRMPLISGKRFDWDTCNGTVFGFADCLTHKGYVFHRLRHPILGEIHLYNVHFDAGGKNEDIEARFKETEQLIHSIKQINVKVPLFVVGDFNMGEWDWPSLAYERLIKALHLTDACTEVRCPYPRNIDKVLYRSSHGFNLQVLRWNKLSGFVDEKGDPLSDHEPVEVMFSLKQNTD